MSLTNPNTPVSQQDLQDFYHKLLPYMGGSFGMIANKFSKGDMYSTDEKMIGQWIDGKPLYQKVVYISSFPNKNTKVYPHGIANIEQVIDVHAFMMASDGGVRIFSGRVDFIEADNTNITIGLETLNYSSYDGYATLQYTKTTDSPISIGDDTDYSTTEKIVGTWIDGSPIYQKTITGLNVTPAYNSWTAITSVSSLNIKYLLDVKHVILDTSLHLNAQCSGIEFRISSGSLDAEYLQNVGRRVINVITIQYTKTTD